MEDQIVRIVPVFSTLSFIENKLLWGDIKSLTINILGNIFAFVPFGFLGWVFPKFKEFKPLVFSFLTVLLTVEALQYFSRLGVFDIDDVLLNTAGVALGYWIFRKFQAENC